MHFQNAGRIIGVSMYLLTGMTKYSAIKVLTQQENNRTALVSTHTVVCVISLKHRCQKKHFLFLSRFLFFTFSIFQCVYNKK